MRGIVFCILVILTGSTVSSQNAKEQYRLDGNMPHGRIGSSVERSKVTHILRHSALEPQKALNIKTGKGQIDISNLLLPGSPLQPSKQDESYIVSSTGKENAQLADLYDIILQDPKKNNASEVLRSILTEKSSSTSSSGKQLNQINNAKNIHTDKGLNISEPASTSKGIAETENKYLKSIPSRRFQQHTSLKLTKPLYKPNKPESTSDILSMLKKYPIDLLSKIIKLAHFFQDKEIPVGSSLNKLSSNSAEELLLAKLKMENAKLKSALQIKAMRPMKLSEVSTKKMLINRIKRPDRSNIGVLKKKENTFNKQAPVIFLSKTKHGMRQQSLEEKSTEALQKATYTRDKSKRLKIQSTFSLPGEQFGSNNSNVHFGKVPRKNILIKLKPGTKMNLQEFLHKKFPMKRSQVKEIYQSRNFPIILQMLKKSKPPSNAKVLLETKHSNKKQYIPKHSQNESLNDKNKPVSTNKFQAYDTIRKSDVNALIPVTKKVVKSSEANISYSPAKSLQRTTAIIGNDKSNQISKKTSSMQRNDILKQTETNTSYQGKPSTMATKTNLIITESPVVIKTNKLMVEQIKNRPVEISTTSKPKSTTVLSTNTLSQQKEQYQRTTSIDNNIGQSVQKITNKKRTVIKITGQQKQKIAPILKEPKVVKFNRKYTTYTPTKEMSYAPLISSNVLSTNTKTNTSYKRKPSSIATITNLIITESPVVITNKLMVAQIKNRPVEISTTSKPKSTTVLSTNTLSQQKEKYQRTTSINNNIGQSVQKIANKKRTVIKITGQHKQKIAPMLKESKVVKFNRKYTTYTPTKEMSYAPLISSNVSQEHLLVHIPSIKENQSSTLAYSPQINDAVRFVSTTNLPSISTAVKNVHMDIKDVNTITYPRNIETISIKETTTKQFHKPSVNTLTTTEVTIDKSNKAISVKVLKPKVSQEQTNSLPIVNSGPAMLSSFEKTTKTTFKPIPTSTPLPTTERINNNFKQTHGHVYQTTAQSIIDLSNKTKVPKGKSDHQPNKVEQLSLLTGQSNTIEKVDSNMADMIHSLIQTALKMPKGSTPELVIKHAMNEMSNPVVKEETLLQADNLTKKLSENIRSNTLNEMTTLRHASALVPKKGPYVIPSPPPTQSKPLPPPPPSLNSNMYSDQLGNEIHTQKMNLPNTAATGIFNSDFISHNHWNKNIGANEQHLSSGSFNQHALPSSPHALLPSSNPFETYEYINGEANYKIGHSHVQTNAAKKFNTNDGIRHKNPDRVYGVFQVPSTSTINPDTVDKLISLLRGLQTATDAAIITQQETTSQSPNIFNQNVDLVQTTMPSINGLNNLIGRHCRMQLQCGSDGFTYLSECMMPENVTGACDGYCPCNSQHTSLRSYIIARLKQRLAKQKAQQPLTTPNMMYFGMIEQTTAMPTVVGVTKSQVDMCISRCPTRVDPVCSARSITHNNACIMKCRRQKMMCFGPCPCEYEDILPAMRRTMVNIDEIIPAGGATVTPAAESSQQLGATVPV